MTASPSELTVTAWPIDKVVPYWRNPRANDTAVDKVVDSIQRYGVQAPILVDRDGTIVAGHTRYRAMRQLGMEQVPVIVTDLDPRKAREYRIIDNRTHEYATWTPDLTLELKEFTDDEVLSTYFPHLNLATDFGDLVKPTTSEQVQAATQEVEDAVRRGEAARQEAVRAPITCPACYHQWHVSPDDLRHWASAAEAGGVKPV